MNIPKEIKLGEILEIAEKYMQPEDIDHHESDLYLKVNPISKKIIDNLAKENRPHVGKFISAIPPHVYWYDIWWAYPNGKAD